MPNNWETLMMLKAQGWRERKGLETALASLLFFK